VSTNIAPSMDALPQSGYSLERIYTNEMHLSVARPGDGDEGEGVAFRWDWEIIDETTFEVRVNLNVEPTASRLERVGVVISARFRVVGQPPAVEFQDFVQLHGVAILMPYARETLSALTARGFYGPVLLPALHVVNLMKTQDTNRTTGAKQLAAGKSVPFALSPGKEHKAAGAKVRSSKGSRSKAKGK